MEASGPTVADLVEAASTAHPEATAVVAADGSLTYAELDARANRLARRLQASGVRPDVPVGICLDRSTGLAVALLGVLKAGGACLPLDPAYPPERLAFMVADAGAGAVVTRAGLAELFPAPRPVVRIDEDAADWATLPGTAPSRSVGPRNLAYLIYTSGSTGTPKGVMLTHGGLVAHHRAAMALYRLGPGDRVLQFCSIGFDASIEEMFPTWASGAAVVFRPEDAPLLGRGWSEWLQDERITVVNLPTAYWAAWARDLDVSGRSVPDDIRLVVVGGEKALGPVYRTWERLSGGRSRWINAYGPTETTCMSTAYEPPPGGADLGDARDPPIGRPLPGTTVSVLDEALRPVAPGITGELLIGGVGLARGYLNHPDLTAQRFVEVGFAAAGGEPARARMYRTGDLVRLRPDGDLDYVGRIDDQVKIRGFRVEVGEVDVALARHPAVAAVAVVAREDPPGERQLVAYIVGKADGAVSAMDLRAFLAARLPDHMVPSVFTLVDDLPLTPNGKVDRAALPARSRSTGGSDAAPHAPGEDRLAAIWADVLGRDAAAIASESDFFELGGHSLLATQLIARVREEFGTETPLRAVFQVPTLAGLTALVLAEAAKVTEESAGSPADTGRAVPLAPQSREPGAPVPLSLAQEQMWRLEAAAVPPGLYNITVMHPLDRPVDHEALRNALAWLVDRHEILRTSFTAEGGQPQQLVAPSAPVPVAFADPSDEPDRQRRIAAQDAEPFDLAQPPLVRVGVFQLDDGPARLAVTLDHLVCDGTGASILMSELMAAYEAARDRRVPTLAPLPVQFADFAIWQRSQVTDDVLGRQLAWWAEILDRMPPGPAVPFDHAPAAAPTRRIAAAVVAVPADARRRLEEVARATGSTLFTVAAAATAAVLGRTGGSTDVVMSTTLSGRTRVELEDLVGMFSGIGRLRADLEGDPGFTAVVTRVRDRVLGMFENQDIPFMQVRRALLPDFPAGGPGLMAALPVEFQYFHTADLHAHEIFFRGQLHPLSITLLDDGTTIAGEVSYKLDFYEPATIERLAGDLERVLAAVGADPSLPLSELPLTPAESR